MGALHPCLEERFSDSGTARGHYFHQDLLVARRIHANKPRRHVDVGSRVDGFVAHVASFRQIEVMDIRVSPPSIPNVTFTQVDLMGILPQEFVGTCESLSCLHALEHFGLGRYGDRIDIEGHKVGLTNLFKLLTRGGKLYLSVPIGPQRVEFNAHRIFSVMYLLGVLETNYRIDAFSFVDDQGNLHENVATNTLDARDNFGCSYGCGIFELTKL